LAEASKNGKRRGVPSKIIASPYVILSDAAWNQQEKKWVVVETSQKSSFGEVDAITKTS
jgi:hypothetical protein